NDVPVHVAHDESLYPHASKFECEGYVAMKREFRKNYRRSIEKRYHYLLDKMERKSLHGLFDSLYLSKIGLALPEGISRKSIEELGQFSAKEWFMPFQESDMFTRLGIGRMIKDIKREIDLKRNGMNLKLSIFSCHDSSIGSLLGAFKVFDGRWPDFGASIILEVQKDKLENEKYVRFVYQDKAM
ncbi:phosphoglycerate mutase-like protein, partial [Rozella allomycis CSF55]